jgi:hypothetical protein
MPCRKTAITLPEDLLCAVDRAASERGESRSRFISEVLRTALRARREALVTRRLNKLFQDETLAQEDRREAMEFGEAASGAWVDEPW